MNVVAFASYPIEAAATRYRLCQFVEPLAKEGISLDIKPFLTSSQFSSLYDRSALATKSLGLIKSVLTRAKDTVTARKADVILVQREAMILGPPIVEWLSTMGNRPMVLDLDDATYLPYTSPTYGALGTTLKWFSKTDDLIRWARIVTCGNRAIAEYVKGKQTEARVIPTVVNNEIFRPGSRSGKEPVVLGWVGTHSTFPYLKTIFPVIQQLGTKHAFRLKIVGAGVKDVRIDGVEVESLDWKLEREVEDFQSIDIGLYPIDSSLYTEQWAANKSGFKAIQYMSVGIPYVASPVGAITELGEQGKTYLQASNADDWYRTLDLLLSDADMRARMGSAGRKHVVENFSLPEQAGKLADALHDAASANVRA